VARREGVPPETLSRIEAGYGTIAWHRGDLWEAKRRFACAVELARGASEGYPEASALNGFSIVSRRLGHYEEAFEASERCVALMREHGSEPRVIRGQAVWARAATALGRYDQAEALLLDCLAGFERIGDDRERAHCLEGLAVNLMEQGRMTESKVRHREAIESLAKFDDAFRLAWSFASVANLLEREGRFREAAMLLGIVRELERTHRFEIVSVTSPRDRARLDQLEVHLGPEETARCFAEVSALSLNQAVVFALNLLAKAD
jgi:tetratricopeptide (TPR) repeat protein